MERTSGEELPELCGRNLGAERGRRVAGTRRQTLAQIGKRFQQLRELATRKSNSDWVRLSEHQTSCLRPDFGFAVPHPLKLLAQISLAILCEVCAICFPVSYSYLME